MRRLAFLLPLLAALLAAPAWAPASTLFAGGEDVDFNCVSSCSTSTNGTTFRSAYARASYGTPGSAGADPATTRFATPAFTGTQTLWVHAQFCVIVGSTCGSNGTSVGGQVIRAMDDAGNPTLILRGTGIAGQLKISSRTSGGTFTDLVTCSLAFDNAALVQLDWFIDYSATGTVTLYKNGVQVCTFTGNVTNGDGATTITAFEFASPGTSGGTGAWSEVIASTTDTRSKALYRLTPNGNGNATAWSGTNPCTVILNATSWNDGSFVSTGTNNQLEQCTVTNSIPAGTWLVDSVVMSARALRGATGPQHFQFVTRTGGADFTSADQNPTTSFSNLNNYVQDVNPNTATAWTTSDLTAAGFNLGLKSTP